MVEQAAHAIGANAPVARVMALYHDVGKTANPHCFVENQLGIGNIHDELKPEESARIIRGHVAQGLKLARQFQLPRPILDAIAEHHGTGVLTFFLHKAQQAAGDDEPVNAAVFTYPGPKPQSKETALLMLADGCESAVRASSDHSPDGIRATVRRILQERIEQQQLDECPLTLRDLERTQAAFCSVLNGLYHPRIEYPDTTNELPIPTRAAT
jgi:putative nucleotidyltransferase with HDIG domain